MNKEFNKRKMHRVIMLLMYIFLIISNYRLYETGSNRNTQSVLNFEDWIGGCVILVLYPIGVYIYEKHIYKKLKI